MAQAGASVPAGSLDVEALRRDTPGCEERIHLNNAGAALPPRSVVDAIRDHLELEARIGGYEAEEAREGEIADVYAAVAELVVAAPRNVAIVENATAAFAQALSSIPFEPGDVIVTTRNDYVSNQIQYLSLAKRFGIEVVRAGESPEGGVDPDDMRRLVRARRPRLVAVTHVPTNSGLVQPVEEVGRICREEGVLYLVDACQSAGQIPLDFEVIGCDFLSATARKFLRGPRGVGFLVVSDRVLGAGLEPLFVDMRGAVWESADRYRPAEGATRFENWEFAWALVLGMGAAVRYALEHGVAPLGERAARLAGRARDRLAAIDGVRVLDRGVRRCAIATAAVEGHDPGALVRGLRERGINTSLSERTYAVLDFDDKGVEGAIRVSPHAYNTEDEIDVMARTLREFAG